MSDDLHSRLVAALQSRLEVARAATSVDWLTFVVAVGDLPPLIADAAEFVSSNDPASTIRHIEAQLRVVERHRPGPVTGIVCTADSCWWPCADIRDLAAGEGIEVPE